jgi:ribosomal protein S18 acetylase RimI-like enzyme
MTPIDPEVAARTRKADAEAVAVRHATHADLPALGRLGALLIRLHHDFDQQRFIAAPPRTEEAYASYLPSNPGQPDVVVLVAEQGGEVLGYTNAAVEGTDYMALRGPAGVLHHIVVEPTRRGAGVGLALVEATVAALVSRGAPRVVRSTAEQNQVAQRLFAPGRLPVDERGQAAGREGAGRKAAGRKGAEVVHPPSTARPER